MRDEHDHLRGSGEVTFRAADLDDVIALAGLASRDRADAFGTDVERAERAASLGHGRSPTYFRRRLADGIILVAVAERRLIGYAQFGPVTMPEARVEVADRSLARLHVESARQGRGVGRRLMLAALARPELADAPRIFLRVSVHNARALALYDRLGFRRAGADDFLAGAIPSGDPIMVLERRRPASE